MQSSGAGGVSRDATTSTITKVTKISVTKKPPVTLSQSGSQSSRDQPAQSITRRIISKRVPLNLTDSTSTSTVTYGGVVHSQAASSSGKDGTGAATRVIRSRSYSPASRVSPVKITQQCTTEAPVAYETTRSVHWKPEYTITSDEQVASARTRCFSDRSPVAERVTRFAREWRPSVERAPVSSSPSASSATPWRYATSSTQASPQFTSATEATRTADSSRSNLQHSARRTLPDPSYSSPTVECRAIFMHQGQSFKFSLPQDAAVNEAISMATEKVLQSVSDTNRLGEKLTISVLPSVMDTTTMGEWLHKNLDQPPVVIIQSSAPDEGAHVEDRSQFFAQEMRRSMEEQTRLLIGLQKQLLEQSAIIQNQASFIQDLQAKDQQQTRLLNESIRDIKADLTNIKGQILGIEEVLTDAGDENRHTKT